MSNLSESEPRPSQPSKVLGHAKRKKAKPTTLAPLAATFGVLSGLFGALMLLVGITRIIWTIEDSYRIDRGDYIPTVIPTLIGVFCTAMSVRWLRSAIRGSPDRADGRWIMGAWGVRAFDNDDALDWANGLDKVTDLSLVESAFAAVEGAEGYLEAPDASKALAACELLARLQGNFGYREGRTAKVDQWVERHPLKPSPELLARASRAIDRVLGPDSELSELWDDNSAWIEAVEDLRRRLRL